MADTAKPAVETIDIRSAMARASARAEDWLYGKKRPDGSGWKPIVVSGKEKVFTDSLSALKSPEAFSALIQAELAKDSSKRMLDIDALHAMIVSSYSISGKKLYTDATKSTLDTAVLQDYFAKKLQPTLSVTLNNTGWPSTQPLPTAPVNTFAAYVEYKLANPKLSSEALIAGFVDPRQIDFHLATIVNTDRALTANEPVENKLARILENFKLDSAGLEHLLKNISVKEADLAATFGSNGKPLATCMLNRNKVLRDGATITKDDVLFLRKELGITDALATPANNTLYQFLSTMQRNETYRKLYNEAVAGTGYEFNTLASLIREINTPNSQSGMPLLANLEQAYIDANTPGGQINDGAGSAIESQIAKVLGKFNFSHNPSADKQLGEVLLRNLVRQKPEALFNTGELIPELDKFVRDGETVTLSDIKQLLRAGIEPGEIKTNNPTQHFEMQVLRSPLRPEVGQFLETIAHPDNQQYFVLTAKTAGKDGFTATLSDYLQHLSGKKPNPGMFAAFENHQKLYSTYLASAGSGTAPTIPEEARKNIIRPSAPADATMLAGSPGAPGVPAGSGLPAPGGVPSAQSNLTAPRMSVAPRMANTFRPIMPGMSGPRTSFGSSRPSLAFGGRSSSFGGRAPQGPPMGSYYDRSAHNSYMNFSPRFNTNNGYQHQNRFAGRSGFGNYGHNTASRHFAPIHSNYMQHRPSSNWRTADTYSHNSGIDHHAYMRPNFKPSNV